MGCAGAKCMNVWVLLGLAWASVVQAWGANSFESERDVDCGRVRLKVTVPSGENVLASTTFETKFESSEDPRGFLVCFEFITVQFDRKAPQCMSVADAAKINVNFLPYGKHWLTAWAQRTDASGTRCSGSFSVVPMQVTPVLPTEQKAKSHAVECGRSFPTESGALKKNDPSENSTIGGLALIVLVNRGRDSLAKASRSWMESGLLDLAQRKVMFFQEYKGAMDLRIDRLPPGHGFEFVGSEHQIGIGPAVNVLVGLVKDAEHVLFLEEDFHVHSSSINQVISTIANARFLLKNGGVDVVKLRHRRFPGDPFYPSVWKGHENDIVKLESPYVSNHSLLETVHWLLDPVSYFGYPSEVLWHCDADVDWFCAHSTHACWSNNPWLASPEFYLKHVAPSAGADWTKSIEGALNLNPHLWDDNCFVLAQGNGLFTHLDLEKPIAAQSPFEKPYDKAIRQRYATVNALLAGEKNQELPLECS